MRAHTVEALLVYLACQDRPLGRDELAELLWPERTQEQSRMNLRGAIYRLRGQIEPYLLITRQNLALNPHATIDLDARQFERYLAAGQLAAAVALYRGDFLEGFYLDGSPAFEQWALLERERLRTLALSAYERLIDETATAGQLDAAIAYAQRLLQLDALHEPTHRQLMRLLAHAGQRSAALAQYEICRQLLSSELDVAPDEMTTMLHERIRTQGQDLETVDGATRIKLSAQPPADYHQDSTLPHTRLHNLPRQPTPLIGRSAELAQIERLLSNPDCRLLTLVGVGGIGKTRLAIEAGQRMLDAGNRRAAQSRIPYAGSPLSRRRLFCFAGACGESRAGAGDDCAKPGPQDHQQRCPGRAGGLFAAPHFAADPGQLRACGGSCRPHRPPAAGCGKHQAIGYLARAPLLAGRVAPACRRPLAGRGLGRRGRPAVPAQRAARSSLALPAAGRNEAIAAIYEQVEGMPLAVELAASWVRVMSCAEIARQIAQNIDIFTTTLRNLPERHRSLHSLFDQSWRLLSPVEQGVLRRVSVFRGGWTLDEAVQVAGATFALLVGLVDKSLVRSNGEGRFDLHELVRQYAAEQLVASGEVDLIHQRHYAAYLQLFRTGDSYLRGPEAATWFARLEPEQDNLRAALQWALAAERYADVAWLQIACSWFWHQRGRWQEFGRWLAQLLPHRHELPVDLHLHTLTSVYAVGSAVTEFQPLDRWKDEMLQLLEICPNQHLHAAAWHFVACYAVDFSEVAAAFERSIAAARTAQEGLALGPEFCLVRRQRLFAWEWPLGVCHDID